MKREDSTTVFKRQDKVKGLTLSHASLVFYSSFNKYILKHIQHDMNEKLRARDLKSSDKRVLRES